MIRIPSLPKEFRLTVYFAVVAATVMLVAATVLVVLNRRITFDRLSLMAEGNNAALTQVFANDVWHEYAPFVSRASSSAIEDLRSAPELDRLHEALTSLMRGSPVIKVKIYDRDGLTVFSTDRGEIGEIGDEGDTTRVAIARDGKIVSELEFEDTLVAFDGPHSDRWVLSSYVPLRADGQSGPIEGIAEVYNDVTGWEAHRIATGALLLGVVVACFCSIFAILVGMIWYADRAIQNEHTRNLGLAANVARAEAASEAKSTFLANMSHELRTPLNAVIGFSEIIQSGRMGPITPNYKEYAGDILTAGRHLLGLINSVLDLVLVESGRMEVHPEPLDISEAMRDVERMTQPDAAKAGLKIKLDLDSKGGPITTDGNKVRQIVINLMANAIKFTPKGGEIILGVERSKSGRHVRIRVADTGVGMKEADIPTALSRFGQIDRGLNRRHEGLGIGLSLSTELANLLGGSLDIESSPSKGTCVTLTLPTTVLQAKASVAA